MIENTICNNHDLTILHVDMDAFYASVEEMDDPYLKGKPVIVGGLSDHGVVTTCNYAARKYGIHSAMPAFRAKQLCPDGIYLSPRMDRYRQVSKDIFEILYSFTEKVEKISVDEAYLDISNLNCNPKEIVYNIKDKIFKDLNLTLSVGISYNKFLAKLASDWNKPNGLKIIKKDMLPEILYPLSIKKVHGIGPKSAKKLNNIGVYTIKDLLRLDLNFLINLFGKSGEEIYHRIRGIDLREVNIERERKSLGIERTFDEETSSLNDLKSYIDIFSKELSQELKNKEIQARTINLKVKSESFKTQTRSKTIIEHTNDYKTIFEIAISLLEDIEIDEKIRLLGVSASNLLSENLEQLSLFD